MTLNTLPWDSAAHLETDEDMANYLNAVLEENDPALAAYALGVIARAKDIRQLARQTGLEREILCQAFSAEGHPEWTTVLKISTALGLRLSVPSAVSSETDCRRAA